jgi:IS30 family transposase
MAGCSPEQIAGRLRRAYPGDMRKQLSAETIYAALYVARCRDFTVSVQTHE